LFNLFLYISYLVISMLSMEGGLFLIGGWDMVYLI
jgi:hypothetical protein